MLKPVPSVKETANTGVPPIVYMPYAFLKNSFTLGTQSNIFYLSVFVSRPRVYFSEETRNAKRLK